MQNFQDNVYATFGSASDLQIYHDGNNSVINESGTGSLKIKASDLFLRAGGTNNTNNAIVAANSGTVTLYHANSAKLATTSSGINVTGGITTATGNFSDNVYLSSGQLYLGASNSTTNDSYRIYAASGQFVLASRESGTWTTRFDIDTSGNATFANNVTVEGNLTVDGDIIHGNHGNGGTYNFSDTVNATSNENIFSISAANGAQAFTVYFTCNTSGVSIAKVYTVVHSYGTTVVYNKLVDSGPYGGVVADDFTPTFTGATDTVTCNIANLSSTNLNIVTTVVLGGSPTALTVTAL
jgi:hypothetical protein